MRVSPYPRVSKKVVRPEVLTRFISMHCVIEQGGTFSVPMALIPKGKILKIAKDHERNGFVVTYTP